MSIGRSSSNELVICMKVLELGDKSILGFLFWNMLEFMSLWLKNILFIVLKVEDSEMFTTRAKVKLPKVERAKVPAKKNSTMDVRLL